MLLPGFANGSSFVVRPYEPGDEAAMFTVTATLQAADAGDLLGWTLRLEETLEGGGAAWVAVRDKRVKGYGIISPVPGLPAVFELTGGVASPWQQRGMGTRLLDAVKRESSAAGARRLSCYVPDLAGDTSRFLLNRDFTIEHEECLLELDMVHTLSAAEESPELSLRTFPRAESVALFPMIYEHSFRGKPWIQPYSMAETEALLDRSEDLLFAMRGNEPVGVAWIEVGIDGHGRIEPFGVVETYHGRGYGRWLLHAALVRLQQRGVRVAQLGLWRDNSAALNLYKQAGFVEVSNWYYLAYDLPQG